MNKSFPASSSGLINKMGPALTEYPSIKTWFAVELPLIKICHNFLDAFVRRHVVGGGGTAPGNSNWFEK